MECKIVVIILLTVVNAELLPSFDLQPPFGAYLADERSTIADCPLRNFKFGGSTLTSAAAVTEVFFNEFPHLAALGWIKENETVWECSGALITLHHVLTTAECANKSLDVARLGDLDLKDSTDDKFVQEFKIVHAILERSIAVLQLNSSVQPHPTVVPACLWTNEHFKFEALKTGSIESHKIQSTTVARVNCQKMDHHTFCTNQTQESDNFGQISEVSLYAQHKLIPFLLGIAVTNQSMVYTKLSSYIPLIEQMVGQSFDPMDCAMRHIDHRQYDPEYFLDKSFNYNRRKGTESSAFVGIVPRTFVITTSPKNHKVRIVGEDGLECSGSVIDKKFVLTTASCVKLFATGPKEVITAWQDTINVEEVHMHPEHHLIYKDIALVKLSKSILFIESAQFACPWPLDIKPTRLNSYGIGPQSLNVYGKDPRVVDLSIKSNVINTTDCNCQLQAASHMRITMVTDAEICVGNPQHLVPGSCKMKLGSPLARASFYHNKYFPFVFGLGTFGEDCGFGSTPVVATKVADHIEWIDSIVFPERESLEPREVTYNTPACYSQYSDYRNNITRYTNDINNQDHATFSSSLVLIGDASNWTCDGVIVHEEFVLSTARCARNASRILIGANLNRTEQQTLYVEDIFIHPEDSLALLRMTPVTFNLSISPACIWFNSTHLPFFLSKPLWDFSAEKVTNMQMHTLSHEECSDGTNSRTHFCAGYQFPVSCQWVSNAVVNMTLCSSTNCASGHGEILLSFEPTALDKLTPVLVGLSSAKDQCDLTKPLQFIRLLMYQDWFQKIIKAQ